jgi:hypothetical protein
LKRNGSSPSSNRIKTAHLSPTQSSIWRVAHLAEWAFALMALELKGDFQGLFRRDQVILKCALNIMRYLLTVAYQSSITHKT